MSGMVFQQEDAAGIDAVPVEVRMVAHQHGFAEQSHHKMYIVEVQVHQCAAAAGRVEHRRHLSGKQGIVPAGILAEGTGAETYSSNAAAIRATDAGIAKFQADYKAVFGE